MLTLTGATTYTFQFDWKATNAATSGSNSEGGQFNLIVNGTSIAFGAAGLTAAGTSKVGHLTGTFTPTTTGSYSVGARMTRQFTVPGAPTAPTLFQYVDNFTQSPAVPEPATMAALGLGIAALLRRKRRS